MLFSLALISIALAALWGTGMAFLGAFRSGREEITRLYRGGVWALFLALPLTAGLLLNYALSFFLVFKTLSPMLAIVAVAGYFGAVLILRRATPPRNALTVGIFVALISVFLVAHSRIALSPLEPGDGRSIWFLHGKFIFANAGAILKVADFSNPAIVYSHVDYPNLVPALAAQFSALAGFWNEYVPKLALSLLLFISLLYIAAIANSLAGFVWLTGIAFFVCRPLLWNGYMDGYLAIYTVLFGCFLGRLFFRQVAFRTNLIACILLAGVMAGLKNEAVLWLGTAGVAAFGLSQFRLNLPARIRELLLNTKDMPGFVSACFCLSFFGYFLWVYHCRVSGLVNDMASAPFVRNAVLRIISEPAAFLLIFKYTIVKTGLWWILPGVAGAHWVSRKTAGAASDLYLYLSFSAMLQLALLFAVYFGTHNPLLWHLTTSANRTVLPAKLMLCFVLYMLVKEHVVANVIHARSEENHK